ncbi:MAG: hypothetical protein OXJ56_02055 [Rhodospirillaceae bacterium]|nr:hypothetical protein [Rhodospirillaceae bacterium]
MTPRRVLNERGGRNAKTVSRVLRVFTANRHVHLEDTMLGEAAVQAALVVKQKLRGG